MVGSGNSFRTTAVFAAGIGGVRLAKDIVQVRNPKTDRYVKVDRDVGRILAEKKSPGPYKDIPVVHKRKDQ